MAVLGVEFMSNKNNSTMQINWGNRSYLMQLDISRLSRSKLKHHLSARQESINGNKKQLVERLENSLERERLEGIAYAQKLEAEHRKTADLEELGAVYVVGSNQDGQLGLGHCKLKPNKNWFQVIPFTRGLKIKHVSCGYNIAFAVTEDHHVYTWGGAGTGPSGLSSSPLNDDNIHTVDDDNTEDNHYFDNNNDDETMTNDLDIGNSQLDYTRLERINDLNGEEVIMTTVGSRHACAITEGGDCFVWGHSAFGTLGLGSENMNSSTSTFTKPILMETFRTSDAIINVDAGDNHTCALTENGEVYSWGHAASGRLGLGIVERPGARSEEKRFFPSPTMIAGILSSLQVIKISCGAEHVLAQGKSRVFSWGSGDGGRLGHGDCANRYSPEPITAFDGSKIIDISAGTWHNASVVLIPPLKDAGWVYTWGSGFHGQLGQENIMRSMKPTLMNDFCKEKIFIQSVICGIYHNAAITSVGELYTWGSNTNGCLGRDIEDSKFSSCFTPHPGHCTSFGVIVDRIGRGLPRSVACGKEFTIVATHPYKGPREAEAKQIMYDERSKERERIRIAEKRQAHLNRETKQDIDRNMKLKEIEFLTSKRYCILDPNCPGFQVHAYKPSICRECGHSSVYHTIIEKPKDNNESKVGDILNKGMKSKYSS